ncbi:GAF domain-containing protein [Pelagibius sp. Alg239-R121]|uniref:GAF domain-containing protein n=1 Tax=Pelagibius sp. Alg239-R121 TaxID=2993448 RepID=UPI0024A6C985|nr:GAF domain-containing protein [Pelagibius sp. Alg239-R121]
MTETKIATTTSGSGDFLGSMASLAEAVANVRRIDEVWAQADAVFGEVIGHRMFTVLRYVEERGEVARLYTNKPDAYPVGGTKPMGPTPWGELVLKRGKPFVGPDADAVRWAYPDHETIIGMGLESALNLPMRLSGETLGTINLTHQSGYYHDGHLQAGSILAALLTPLLVQYPSEHSSNHETRIS